MTEMLMAELQEKVEKVELVVGLVTAKEKMGTQGPNIQNQVTEDKCFNL